MPELKLCVITVLCVTTIAFLISNLVTQGEVHDKMRERAIGTQSRWDTRRGAVIRQCTEGITVACTAHRSVWGKTVNRYGCGCQKWNWVIADTGTRDWEYNSRPELKNRLTVIKMMPKPLVK